MLLSKFRVMSRKQVFIFFWFETSVLAVGLKRPAYASIRFKRTFQTSRDVSMADDAFDNEDNAMTVHTAGNIAVSCAASAGDMYDRAVAGLPGIAALKLPLEQRLHKFKDVASGVTAIGSKISHQCQVAVIFVATQCLDMYRAAETERRAQNPRPVPIVAWPLICAALHDTFSERLRVGMKSNGVFHKLCIAIANAPATARRPIFDGLCALFPDFTIQSARACVKDICDPGACVRAGSSPGGREPVPAQQISCQLPGNSSVAGNLLKKVAAAGMCVCACVCVCVLRVYVRVYVCVCGVPFLNRVASDLPQ
jgi:hypothetical protein